MRRFLLVALLAPLAAGTAAQEKDAKDEKDKVIEVRTSAGTSGSLEALWADYRKALEAKDVEGSVKTFREIVRLRAERNIRSLEEMALALVDRGLDHVQKGDRDAAEQDFKGAAALDPFLPDAYLGMALLEMKAGPGGFVGAARDTASALMVRLRTTRGGYNFLALLIPSALLALLLTAFVFAAAMLVRYGALLLHDLEEDFTASRGRPFTLGLFALLLFLPLVALQGYGWLPLWWLALLFIYLGVTERVVAVLCLATGLLVGPLSKMLDDRAVAVQNPLFRTCVTGMEGGPDNRTMAELAGAAGANKDDRDLSYLLAAQHKKGGRYEDAANVYQDILKTDGKDSVALNNLANLDFAKADFAAAIARYRQGVASSTTPDFTATLYYNLQLAHRQKFEFDPANEARAQADKLAASLVQSYEGLWKYEAGGTAVPMVADLGLTQDQVWAKFQGVREGIGRKNLAGKNVDGSDPVTLAQSELNRFAAFGLVFAGVYFGLSSWRGKKMFTLRCPKCGTPFCRRCHLGTAAGGLCTQCYHLFVMKDGVSTQARNQKMSEIQEEEGRRRRVFRILSLVSPGAGHLYAQKTIFGLVLIVVWYAVLVPSLLSGRVFPLTEAPSRLLGAWALAPAVVLLLLTFIVANRAVPDFEAPLPVVRRAPRRPVAAAG